jgi:hypothetical protein
MAGSAAWEVVAADGGDDCGTGPVGELGGEGADRTERAVDEHGGAVDRAVGEDGSVSRDAGDTESGADPVVDLVGQIRCQLVGTTAYLAAVSKAR